MTGLVSFFLILLMGTMMSGLFRRLHLPWVVALIAGGLIIGQSGFDLIPADPVMDFFSEIGLIFLMFIAGLETRFSDLVKDFGKVSFVALVNGAIPFAVGLGVTLLFGYDMPAALLVGIMFISSSVAVVIPTLSSTGLLHQRLGRTIVATTLLQDIASLILLSILFQTTDGTAVLPLPLFYLIVVAIFVALRLLVPKVNKTIIGYVHQTDTQDLFQKEVRIVFLILIGTVITFELLGLHPIIGSFLAGLILSDSISSEQLMSKIRTLSYGIFIPVFFVVVGVRTDLSILSNAGGSWWLVVAIVASSVISKLVSGYLGAIASKFSRRESLAIATTSIPQLTTTLAVAFIGLDSEIIDHKLIAAMVILILVTTALSPLLLSNLVERTKKDDSIVSLPAE